MLTQTIVNFKVPHAIPYLVTKGIHYVVHKSYL
jgi:hypothetical protein